MGGTRPRHFDATNLKPRKVLENAHAVPTDGSPTTCPGVLCRGLGALSRCSLPRLFGAGVRDAVLGADFGELYNSIIGILICINQHPPTLCELYHVLSVLNS
jgi:hypothetical protein